MSAKWRVRPDRAMSSQSRAVAPMTRYTPTVAQASRLTAKKRGLSPLSLWVQTTPSSQDVEAMPLDSLISGSAKPHTSRAGP